jgi:hypothetical protein
MYRKTLIAIVLVALVALVLAVFGAAAEEEKAGVTIINNTDQTVALALTGDVVYYYLAAPAGVTSYFSVDRQVYDQVTYSCGLVESGTIDLTKVTRLNFTPCEGDAPNAGEPSLEKVHLDGTPSGIEWYYQY